jgi:osmotically inducible protein OsmC
MLIRKAEAKWRGNLVQGSGRLTVGSGAIDVPYSFKSRLEDGQSATNPEELLGAAHAGCFTMALAAQLSGAGFMPSELDTVAKGSFEKVGNNFQITRIELETSGNVPGIDETTFQALAADAKQNCPVSKALAATEIKLKATLRQAETSRAPTDVAIQVTN